jgi:hypothetical protein
MHDGAIDPAPQAVAEFEGVARRSLFWVGRCALSRTSRASTTLGTKSSAVSSRATKNATVPLSSATGVAMGSRCASCQRRKPSGVVGISPCAITCPCPSWITNTLALLCTSNPT